MKVHKTIRKLWTCMKFHTKNQNYKYILLTGSSLSNSEAQLHFFSVHLKMFFNQKLPSTPQAQFWLIAIFDDCTFIVDGNRKMQLKIFCCAKSLHIFRGNFGINCDWTKFLAVEVPWMVGMRKTEWRIIDSC